MLDDEAWLEEKYVKDNLSSTSIAKLCGVTHHTITARLKKFNIPIKTPGQKMAFDDPRLYDLQWMTKHYVSQKLSSRQIAKIVGCSPKTASSAISKLGLTRSISESIKIQDERLSFDYLYHHYIELKKPCSQIAKEIGCGKSTIRVRLCEHGIKMRTFRDYTKFRSNGELELCEFIESMGFAIKTNDYNLLGNFELDIIIPDYKIALEFNGQYFHTDNRLGENFHKIKSERCRRAGYHLIHVWEWLWIDNKDWYKEVISDIISKNDLKKYGNKLDASIFPRLGNHIRTELDVVWVKGKLISNTSKPGYLKLTKCGVDIYK